MTNEAYYVSEYDGKQCGMPAFVSGTFNQTEFEWNLADPESLADAPINRSYEFHVTDRYLKSLDFDFYDPSSPIVSSDFLRVCDALSIAYRTVPLRVTFSVDRCPEQKFYLFLPCQSTAILNRSNSEYQEDKVLETGETMMNRFFSEKPIYSWIKRFTITPTPLHLFRCIELLQLVVSDRFVELARENGITGAKFVAIDETYQYDPWHEIP